MTVPNVANEFEDCIPRFLDPMPPLATATPRRGGLPYLDAVLPAEHRLAATRVVRDLGALPPDVILYLLAQPLLDLAQRSPPAPYPTRPMLLARLRTSP